jgi:ATP-dependent protease ClpP protease subunit
MSKEQATQNDIYLIERKLMKSKLYNLKSKHVPNLSRFRASEDDDDIQNILGSTKQLGYFTQQKVSTCIVVPIDENVRDADYYRQVVQAISNTDEDDVIQFEINSNGGSLEGLIALLTAMSKTQALKLANINGFCHSAASMLALNCDSIFVSPYASSLIHFVSYGSSGKSADIRSHVNHVHTTSEALFRETYALFLTEEEMQACIDGKELWVGSDEISRRLEHKYSILNAEDEVKVEPVVTAEEEEEWLAIEATSVPKAKKAGKPKAPK